MTITTTGTRLSSQRSLAPRHVRRRACLGVAACLLAITGPVVGREASHASHAPDAVSPRLAARVAQDDGSRLIGTWTLVEFTRRATDGTVTTPWGTRPVGQITYGADRQVTALLMHERRNEAGGQPSSPEVQAEFSAYFGVYSIDAVRQVITHRVTGSLSAARASGELRRNYAFQDGTLILTFTRTQDGATNTLVWKRVS